MEPNELNPEQIHSLIEEEFHSHNKLWGDVATAFAEASLKLFDDTIRFVYQALTAMGFVAGFGFAGIQDVQSIGLFVGGEAFMFIALMYGFYIVKYIYTQNTIPVEEKSRRIREVYEKKSIVLGEMMKEVRTKGRVENKSYVADYESVNKEILELHGVEKNKWRIRINRGL